jgi:hypothetical protein
MVEIREKLHHFIDTIEDKKVAIYTLFEESIEHGGEDYTAEFKTELYRRYAEHKKDGKVISRERMDNRIKKILTQKDQVE